MTASAAQAAVERGCELYPDDATVTRILAAILECPATQRMDSFAVATDAFVRGICKPLDLHADKKLEITQ